MKPANKTKACIGGGVLLLVVSVLMIILGVFVTDVVDDLINDTVESGLKLSPGDESDNSSSWNDWVNTDKYYAYNVFNYTNVDAMFEDGAKPQVEEIGPFTYQEFNQNYNISFVQDDRVVLYNKWWYKVHAPQGDEPDPATTMVWNMNPIYWGLASQVWALVKADLYSAFAETAQGTGNATEAAKYANPNANFPFGILGPLTIPANHVGPFTPPVDVTVPKSDSIVGLYAGQLVLATMGTVFKASVAPQLKGAFFPGILRALADDMYVNSTTRNPVDNLLLPFAVRPVDENDGLSGAAGVWVGSTESPASTDVIDEYAYMQICDTFSADPTVCQFGAALAAQHSTTDLTTLLNHVETLTSPTSADGLFNPRNFSNTWGHAVSVVSTNPADPMVGHLFTTFGQNVTLSVFGWLGGLLQSTNASTVASLEEHSVRGTYLNNVDGGILVAYQTITGTQFNPVSFDAPSLAAATGAGTAGVDAIFTGTLMVGNRVPQTYVEMSFLQFARLTALGGETVAALSTTAPVSLSFVPPGVQRGGDRYYGPEWAAFQKGRNATASDMKWDQAQRLIDEDAPLSLANSTFYGAYLLDTLVSPTKVGSVVNNSLAAAGAPVTSPDTLYNINNETYDDLKEFITKYSPFHQLIFGNMIAQNFGPFYEVSMESLLFGTQAATNGSGEAPAALKQLLQPLNDKLVAEGKPELNPDNPGLVTTYASQEDHFEQTHQGLYGLVTGSGGNLKNVRSYYQYRGFSSFTKLPALTGDQTEQARDPAQLFAVSLCQYSELDDTDPSCIAWREEEFLYKENSDGTVFSASTGNNFAPFTEGDDPASRRLRVWIAEGQRVIDAVFKETIEFKGIKMNRYVAPPEVVKSAKNANDSNYKYRMDSTPTGIVPMDLVARGLPAAVTRPHFWESDPKQVINKVGGMNPVEADHFTFIDVEPLTGATMRGAKRFMNNLRMDPEQNDWAYFSKVWDFIPDTPTADSETEGKFIYLPWYWGTESGEIDDDDAKDFREGVYDNRDLAEVLSVVFLVVGIALAAGSTICLVYYCRKKDDAKQERVPSQVSLATGGTA